jgi:hypothetical protein
MKKILYIFAIFATTISLAQRQDDSWAIQARGGLLMGKGSGDLLGSASSFEIGGSYYLKGGWMIEGNFTLDDFMVDLDKRKLPYQVYSFNPMGGWSWEATNILYMNFKIGGILGFEKVNKNEPTDPIYGAKLPYPNEKNNFIYGFILSPEMEVRLYKGLSLLVNPYQNWYKGSKYADWKGGLRAGIKYYF